MSRLAADPHYFARPDRTLFQDIRRYFPITAQAQVAWAVREGVGAAVAFIEEQIEAGALRRRHRPLPRDDPQGQGLPAHPAARPRLLPVAPAPRSARRSPPRRATLGSPHGACGHGRARDPSGALRALSSQPHVARHRQADPAALARRLPDGGAPAADRARREGQRRGLLGDVRRGLRAALLLGSRRAHRRSASRCTSQRDEFTGEELYTLRSENYFLDRLDLDDDELAALQTALFYLDGKFAYAEPLRLALQNLALGRPGFQDAPTDTAERVRVSAPDYSPELAGRLSKLESAISKQRTIKFTYWSPQRDKVTERTLNPYALRLDEGVWYVVGQDLDRDADPHLPGLPHPQRHPLRDPARARLPPAAGLRRRGAPRPEAVADRRDRRHRAHRGAGRHRLVGPPHAQRCGRARGRRLRDGVRAHRAARGLGAAPERPRRPARAEGAAHSRRRGPRLRRLPRRRAARRSPASAASTRPPTVATDPSGPVAPERFGVLQALLAQVLSACGDGRDAVLDADDLAMRFSIPREELQDTLSLLNLVNFGGGCYTVYAEVDEDDRARCASTRSSTATSSAGRRS